MYKTEGRQLNILQMITVLWHYISLITRLDLKCCCFLTLFLCFSNFAPWQLKPRIILQHKLTSLFQQHSGVWAGLSVKLWDADLYSVRLGQYYEVAEMVRVVQIQIQHTRELINAQKTSHKHNNKDLSHLR